MGDGWWWMSHEAHSMMRDADDADNQCDGDAAAAAAAVAHAEGEMRCQCTGAWTSIANGVETGEHRHKQREHHWEQ